jgi:hypothetical protein
MIDLTRVVGLLFLAVPLLVPTSSDRGLVRVSKRTVLMLFTLLFLALLVGGRLSHP